MGRKYAFLEKSSRKKDKEKVPAKRCLCAHPALQDVPLRGNLKGLFHEDKECHVRSRPDILDPPGLVVP